MEASRRRSMSNDSLDSVQVFSAKNSASLVVLNDEIIAYMYMQCNT